MQDYQGAFATLRFLPGARQLWDNLGKAGSITEYPALASQVFTEYTTIIAAFINATSQVPLQVSDPTLRTGVEALDTSLNVTETEWGVVQALFVAAWSPPQTLASAASAATLAYGTEQAWYQRLTELAKGPYASAVNILVASTVGESIQVDVQLVQENMYPSMPALLQGFSEPAPETYKSTYSTANLITTGNQAIKAVVTRRAGELHNNAVQQAEVFGILAVVTGILGLLLVALVSRSISRPLVSLAHQADKLATDTLPATVEAILEASSSSELPTPLL